MMSGTATAAAGQTKGEEPHQEGFQDVHNGKTPTSGERERALSLERSLALAAGIASLRPHRLRMRMPYRSVERIRHLIDEPALVEVQDALGPRRRPRVVRHHDDRLVQTLLQLDEQVENVLGRASNRGRRSARRPRSASGR